MLQFAKNFKLIIDKFSLLFRLKKKINRENDRQKKNIRVAERPRSLDPGKVIAMAISLITVHFITLGALDQCHGV